MKLHLVDATFELFRAFYSRPARQAPDGRPVNAVQGLIDSMLSLLREDDLTHIGAATDYVIESWRNDVFPGYKSSAGIDRALLATPVVGPLRRRIATARLERTLATLLGSGLPILPALEIAAASQADAAVAEEVLRAREEVRAGDRLNASLRRGGVFPFLFVQMVEVGEEGGRLPEMLERAAAAMHGPDERAWVGSPEAPATLAARTELAAPDEPNQAGAAEGEEGT